MDQRYKGVRPMLLPLRGDGDVKFKEKSVT